MLGLQHVVTLDIRLQHIAVAPPRGVRGLKYYHLAVELASAGVAPPRGVRGLKWFRQELNSVCYVAPPRGVRGLKLERWFGNVCGKGRTPSWGAWIEIISFSIFS